jgi:uncharacterized protein (DUF3084 family)
MEVEKGELWR